MLVLAVAALIYLKIQLNTYNNILLLKDYMYVSIMNMTLINISPNNRFTLKYQYMKYDIAGI